VNSRPSSEKLFQLKKIMRVRVTKAHRAYSEKLIDWKKFKQKYDDLQTQVEALQAELDKVVDYQVHNKNHRDTWVRKEASDRRHWVIYDQDLAVYKRNAARSNLDEATTELNMCKAAWLRAQHKEKTIGEQGELALTAEALIQEELQESEVEDLPMPGVSIA